MLIKYLNNIDEFEFHDYSLAKTNEVLHTLENIYWSDISDKNLEENSGFYTRLLDIIDYRVINNAFPEISDNPEEKSHLLLEVLRVKTSISQYRLLFLRADVENKLFERVAEVNESFEKTEAKINCIAADAQLSTKNLSNKTIKQINNHLKESENEFDRKLNKKIKTTINKIEPQLITTVLTLMGVFSAIITIIMSVVITSSSWLNNAEGPSAIIAFIVPNLVVVFSIVILLLVTTSRKNPELVIIPEKNWDRPTLIDKALKKARNTRIGTYIIIVIFTAILVGYALFNLEASDNGKPHLRYVLSQGMYDCVETQDDDEESKTTIIEFEINNKNYIFPYDEQYFHEGKLYFCEEHQRLE